MTFPPGDMYTSNVDVIGYDDVDGRPARRSLGRAGHEPEHLLRRAPRPHSVLVPLVAEGHVAQGPEAAEHSGLVLVVEHADERVDAAERHDLVLRPLALGPRLLGELLGGLRAHGGVVLAQHVHQARQREHMVRE